MRPFRVSFAALSMLCCALVACGDDAPSAGSATTAASAATASSTGDTSAAGATSGSTAGAPTTTGPDIGSGDLNCDELKVTLAGLTTNWQVIIGLVNAPTSDWDDVPLGNISEFGNQLETVTAALGKNSQAAGALSYMSGANDIVTRGLGGDTTAQADLAAYLGPDASVNVNKQIPIALAFQNAGCS